MLDDSTFKSTLIQFRNEAGNVVTLRDVPACFQDAGMILTETDSGYHVHGVAIDTTWGYSGYVDDNLSPGSGLQLLHNGPCTHFSRCSCSSEEASEDYFFVGGVKHPRCKRPELCNGKVYINYVHLEGYFTGYDSSVRVAGHEVCSDTVIENFEKRGIVCGWNAYELECLFYCFRDQYFKSYKALADAIDTISVDNDVACLSTKVFRMDEFLKSECITKPQWAYKWLSCYDHSGVSYFEAGTRSTDRWDTSTNAGVWYLGDEEIARLSALSEEERDKQIEKAFEHDMALISDNAYPYAFFETLYDKHSWKQIEHCLNATAQFEGVDFPYDNATAMLELLAKPSYKVDGETPKCIRHRYTVLQEEKCNPYPWS